MAAELNIGKILSPILSTSRVKAMKRQNRDSPKKRFQKYFEDEKENKSDDGPAGNTETESLTAGSGDEKMREPLDRDLGKQIDIHV